MTALTRGLARTTSGRGVTIKVRADTRGAETDLARLTRSVDRIDQRISKFARSAKIAAAAFGGFLALNAGLKKISAVTDGMVELENKLALVTGRGKELNQTFLKLRDISGRTRSSVQSSATIYNRFGLALKETGIQSDELLNITESLQKAIKISGAGAASAEAAIIQLGQGMASGELRGEELNSVLEQTPRIAQSIAKELGTTVGSLRALAKEGQITTDVVRRALINDTEALTKEFQLLDATTGSLAVVLRDELGLAFSKIDRATGVSGGIQKNIKAMIRALYSFNNNFDNISMNIKVIINNIQQYFADLKVGVQNYLMNTFKGTRWETAFDSLNKSYLKVKNFIDSIIELFRGAWDKIVGNSFWPEIFYEGSRSIAGVHTYDAMQKVLGWIKSFINQIETLFKNTRDIVVNLWSNINEAIASQDFSKTFENIEFGNFFDGIDIAGDFRNWLRSQSDMLIAATTLGVGIAMRFGLRKAIYGAFAFAMAPSILNSGEFQAILKSFGRGIGAALKDIFTGDGDFGEQLVKGIRDSLMALGEGVWAGLFPEGPIANSLQATLTGVLTSVAIGFLISSKISSMLIRAFGALSMRVGVAAYAAGRKQGKKFVSGFGARTKAGIAAALVIALSAAVANDGGDGTELSARLASAAFDVATWGTYGAAIGVIFGPAGAAGGAIIGSLVGALMAVWNDPGLIADAGSFIADLGKDFTAMVVSGFNLAVGKLSEFFGSLTSNLKTAIIDGFNAAKDAVKGWLSDIFSGIVEFFKPGEPLNYPPNHPMAQAEGKASGGYISGPGTGTSDDIPTMLSNGEYVIKASSVSKFGKGFLDRINQGEVPQHRAEGGIMGEVIRTASGYSDSIRNAGFLSAVIYKGGGGGITDAMLTDKLNAGDTRGRFGNLFSGKADDDVYEILTGAVKDILEAMILSVGLNSVPGVGTLLSLMPLVEGLALKPLQGLSRGLRKTGSYDSINNTLDSFLSNFEKGVTLSDLKDHALRVPKSALKAITGITSGALSSFWNWASGGGGSDDPNRPAHLRNFATGGRINGPGTGTSDSIPAMLSNGEYVIKASSVSKYGPGFMEMINNGLLPKFATGGAVDTTLSTLRGRLATEEAKRNRIITQNKMMKIDNPDYIPRTTTHIDDNIRLLSDRINSLSESNASSANSASNLSSGGVVTDNGSGGGSGSGTDKKRTSLKGTVGNVMEALSNLGLDQNLALFGPDALAQGRKLVDLQKELSALNVTDVENIRIKNAEIEKQQELLDGILQGEGSNSIKDSFAYSLKSGLDSFARGGSLEDAFFGVLDSVTSAIIDNFTTGLTDAIMGSDMMTGIFDNFLNEDTFKGLGESLGNIFKDLSSSLGEMFKGLGGEGGFLSSIFSFLKFDSGGVVPMTPGAQSGKDSVPAMLKPGERVLSKNDIANGQRGANKGGSGTSQFNINVTGDVTRQTRREIMEMIPQIAQGVNSTNHETNFQYR